ncbi:MAG: rRNA methyltransferase [Gammaproteobacteria bacterium HGW-Gammaproteobacteria-1]|jgi:16S rRNA (guanine1207-N2)-methyltransferase|nr:MAG: rRNA methyltransferase [Gammaproteobacteria bacterium HGW-Gammaproteobacteria-1]
MSQDGALALLFPLVHAQRAPALWVLGEHGGGAGMPLPNTAVAVLSNRVDVSDGMRAAGWAARFSDFDFAPWPAASLDAVFFRLAKEKPVVHHVINAAAELLAPGGRLLLSGAKQQGIKTYARNAAARLGGTLELKKLGHQYLAVVQRGAAVGAALEERDYSRLRPAIEDGSLHYLTKPGLYGWDQVDAGSALLVAHLPSCTPARVCDLGCGYGYLSVQAWLKLRPQQVVACDNNAAAVLACRANFAAHGIAGEVLAADCGDGIGDAFDLVLCNPPFHQGFGVEHDLTERFVAAARRLTARGGQAVFVTNAFLPIEKVARRHYARVVTLADDGRFRVTQLLP